MFSVRYFFFFRVAWKILNGSIKNSEIVELDFGVDPDHIRIQEFVKDL